jgi:hypothetical protein
MEWQKMTEKIINFAKKPKSWIIFNIIISTIIIIIFINYKIISNNEETTIDEKRLSKLQTQAKFILQDIIEIKSLKILPNIKAQIDLAPLYFASYGLDFEKQQTHKNGVYIHAVVSGDLNSLLLSINDLNLTKLPVRYKNIAIEGNKAALHIVILGSK